MLYSIKRRLCSLGLAFVWVLSLQAESSAYVGPGAGLSALGSLLALIGAIILAIVGFLWYPIKRLLKKNRIARSNKEIS